VKVGRPSSVEELLALISAFPRAKGVGVGHSWWQQQFCPTEATNEPAIGIVTTEIASTLALYVAFLSNIWVHDPSSCRECTADDMEVLDICKICICAGYRTRHMLRASLLTSPSRSMRMP
jgi:hypothetical protein